MLDISKKETGEVIVFIDHKKLENWGEDTIDIPYGWGSELKLSELKIIPYIRSVELGYKDFTEEQSHFWDSCMLLIDVLSDSKAELIITVLEPLSFNYRGDRDNYILTMQKIVEDRDGLNMENPAMDEELANENYELYEELRDENPNIGYSPVGMITFSCTIDAHTYGEIIQKAESLLKDLDYWTKFQLGV